MKFLLSISFYTPNLEFGDSFFLLGALSGGTQEWPSGVIGGFWPDHGQFPRAQNLKGGVQWGAMGPGGKSHQAQTQKQDGIDGPKLTNKMASLGPNSKTRWRPAFA